MGSGDVRKRLFLRLAGRICHTRNTHSQFFQLGCTPHHTHAHTHRGHPYASAPSPRFEHLAPPPLTRKDTDAKRLLHILGGVCVCVPAVLHIPSSGLEVHSAAPRPSDRVCLWVVVHVAMQPLWHVLLSVGVMDVGQAANVI